MIIKQIVVLLFCLGAMNGLRANDDFGVSSKNCSKLLSSVFKRGSIINFNLSPDIQIKLDDAIFAYQRGLRVEVRDGHEKFIGEVISIKDEHEIVKVILKSRIHGKKTLYLTEFVSLKVITQKEFEKKIERAFLALDKNAKEIFLQVKEALEKRVFVEVKAGYTSIKGKVIDIIADENSGIMFYVESKYQGIKPFYLIDQTIKIKRAVKEKY